MRNCWSLKGITLAPSMSSTRRCSQILSGGYLLALPVSPSVYHSLLSSQGDERTPFFLRGFCFSLPGPLFYFFVWALRSTSVKLRRENKDVNSCHRCLLREIILCGTAVPSQTPQTGPGSGLLMSTSPWLISKPLSSTVHQVDN